MIVLSYIAGGLLCIGWAVLIIMSLSSKSEYDKLEELLISHTTKKKNHSPSEVSTLDQNLPD